MAYEAVLNTWIDNVEDEELLAELTQMRDSGDEAAIADAFFQDLAFGTAGLRGIIGAGTNRMNIYTVARATQGLANYLNGIYPEPRVAIARDSRNKGELFVQVTAGVLAANGVKCFLYPRIEPTPALSWATRELACQAGINMTASHNPAAYNGYKVYASDGCQITSKAAKAILDEIDKLDIFADVKRMPFDEALESGLVSWIDDEVVDKYVQQSIRCTPGFAGATEAAPCELLKDLNIVYTPLNGAGLECVTRTLKALGIGGLTVVPEQEQPDGNFPTCPYPNPEIREALQLGIDLCEQVKPDLLLATDPDSDRVGIAVENGDDFVLLTGNEVGVLLTDWLCRLQEEGIGRLEERVVVSTIVSSSMLDALSKRYGFQLRRVLTGFKYIGEQIALLEADNMAGRYLIGFEESYGYLSGTHVRDKDAVNASALICAMAAWYKQRGMNLAQAMDALYREFGYYKNATLTFEFPGAAGAQRMSEILEGLRAEAPAEVGGYAVLQATDYADGAAMPTMGGCGERFGDVPQNLPGANVLQYALQGDNVCIVRPSGTEPKIKVYCFAKGATAEEAQQVLEQLKAAAADLVA